MPFKYIGRTTDFKGKTLWEIVGNLKNFGVGRIVTRSRFERYPEPCYMKIVKVETLKAPPTVTLDNVRSVHVWVERVFRGQKSPKLVVIQEASYKADYRLIPKDEEDSYCKYDGPLPQQKIYPKTMSFPPLLQELLSKEMAAKEQSVANSPELEIVYMKSNQNNFRIAQEGEKPTVEVVIGLGKPIAPRLYEGLGI